MQLNCSSTTRSSHSGERSFILTDCSLSNSLRHLRAVEEKRGEVYIDSSVYDDKNLTSLYLAAMTKEDAEAKLRPPGFHLPNLTNLNETDATWKVVAINYSFGSLGLGIPGWDSGKGSATYHSPTSSRIGGDPPPEFQLKAKCDVPEPEQQASVLQRGGCGDQL